MMVVESLFSCPDYQEAYTQFLHYIHSLSGSASSVRTYASFLRDFFKDPDRAPDDYEKNDVLRFLSAPSHSRRSFGQPVSAATMNHRKSCLQSFLKFCQEWMIDTEHGKEPLYNRPLATMSIRRLKEAHPYKSMSTEELTRFWLAIPQTYRDPIVIARNQALFCFYLETCRRRNEVLRLTWGDLTPTTFVEQDGSLRQGILYRYTGKGRSRSPLQKELPLIAWGRLQDYLRLAARLDTMKPESYLFVTSHIGQGFKQGTLKDPANTPLAHDYVSTLFKDVCSVAGLDTKRLSLHSLRHAGAHERALSGATVQEIQNALDHVEIAHTFRYLNFISGERDKSLDRLEQRLAFLTH